MKLKQVGFFKELHHGSPDGGSLEASASDSKQESQKEILDYLNSGEVVVASPGLVKDVLDGGNKIIGSANILTDGVWAWPQDLIYYVETYNVRLPLEFVSHISGNNWTVPDVDVTAVEL